MSKSFCLCHKLMRFWMYSPTKLRFYSERAKVLSRKIENTHVMHHVSCLFHKPPIYIAASETNEKQQDWTTKANNLVLYFFIFVFYGPYFFFFFLYPQFFLKKVKQVIQKGRKIVNNLKGSRLCRISVCFTFVSVVSLFISHTKVKHKFNL